MIVVLRHFLAMVLINVVWLSNVMIVHRILQLSAIFVILGSLVMALMNVVLLATVLIALPILLIFVILVLSAMVETIQGLARPVSRTVTNVKLILQLSVILVQLVILGMEPENAHVLSLTVQTAQQILLRFVMLVILDMEEITQELAQPV